MQERLEVLNALNARQYQDIPVAVRVYLTEYGCQLRSRLGRVGESIGHWWFGLFDSQATNGMLLGYSEYPSLGFAEVYPVKATENTWERVHTHRRAVEMREVIGMVLNLGGVSFESLTNNPEAEIDVPLWLPWNPYKPYKPKETSNEQ